MESVEKAYVSENEMPIFCGPKVKLDLYVKQAEAVEPVLSPLNAPHANLERGKRLPRRRMQPLSCVGLLDAVGAAMQQRGTAILFELIDLLLRHPVECELAF